MRVRWATFLLLFGGSCLEPTEIRVHLSTNIVGLRNVRLYIDDPMVPFATLDPKGVGNLGFIVLVPSADDKKMDKFTLHVEGSTRADGSCASGCVKASRSISYIQHTALDLPIELDKQCVDVECSPGATCFRGRCVDDRVICALTGKSCDVSDDGGAPPLDSGVDAPIDATIDGGIACTSGAMGKIAFAAPTHWWKFDEMPPYKDWIGTSDITPKNGFITVANLAAPECNLALALKGTNMLLGNATNNGAMGLVFDLVVPIATATSLLEARDAMNALNFWNVSLYVNGPKWGLSFGATNNTMKQGTILTTPDTKSHHVEIKGSGNTIVYVIDGVQDTLTFSGPPIPMGQFPITIAGFTQSQMTIDNLYVYPVP